MTIASRHQRIKFLNSWTDPFASNRREDRRPPPLGKTANLFESPPSPLKLPPDAPEGEFRYPASPRKKMIKQAENASFFSLYIGRDKPINRIEKSLHKAAVKINKILNGREV
jgi:hypothetical protein